ncbi:MAG: response regulator [Gammaproteobacteria bacterium]|nr:response regulator [Gammaproteobacteria bacterium]
MRILLVEDDDILANTLSQALRQSSYVVDLVTDGIAADAALTHDVFDLVVLDLGLPGLDGMQVLKQLRARKSTVPVLILTARDSLADRVSGLDFGSDDYLTKPFDLLELEARIRALIRRKHGVSETLIAYGPLRYDTVDKSVLVGDQALDLSARELSVLEILLLRAGRVVSKEHLAERLYGWGEEVGDNAIEVGVHRLRKKLEPVGITIRTIRGLGYLLDKPDAG